jgi:hypothetical protein
MTWKNRFTQSKRSNSVIEIYHKILGRGSLSILAVFIAKRQNTRLNNLMQVVKPAL